jgi:hypothetical protein
VHTKVFYGTSLVECGIKLILCSVRPLFYAIFRSFVSPWGCIGIVGFVVMEIELPIIRLRDAFFACSWRRCTMVVMLFMHWAISHYGSLIHQT